ncbi:MAG: PEP-CTERM sorting domain-containing protein [Bryobacteraceae bacterium]
MLRSTFCAVALLSLFSTVNAAVITFDTDPFAGSDALTTPGRQVVGGEPSIEFSIASDVFAFQPAVFAAGNQVLFVNDVVNNLPTSGVNIVVFQTFDNDDDPLTPFGAGNAATLIAGQITSVSPGFFIYFNSGLDLPRLVYSTDLGDETADLKILARMTNLGGQAGRDAVPTFTEANFTFVPEPSSLFLMSAAGVFGACGYVLRRRRPRG